MDLNGKVVLGINELRQDRKVPEPSAMRSQDFSPPLFNVLFECQPVIGPSVYDRRTVGMTGQFPGFRKYGTVKCDVVLLCQSVASPYIVLA